MAMSKGVKIGIGVAIVALLGYFAWKKGLFGKKAEVSTTVVEKDPAVVQARLDAAKAKEELDAAKASKDLARQKAAQEAYMSRLNQIRAAQNAASQLVHTTQTQSSRG